MANTRIDEIVESLRSLEASSAGRQALSSPRRGDYTWADESPHATEACSGIDDDDNG